MQTFGKYAIFDKTNGCFEIFIIVLRYTWSWNLIGSSATWSHNLAQKTLNPGHYVYKRKFHLRLYPTAQDITITYYLFELFVLLGW